MNEMEYLKIIEKSLRDEQFECSLEPDATAPPFGRLLVYLGNDYKQRERILTIKSQHQILGESLKVPSEPPQFTHIQFEIELPFSIKEHIANEVLGLTAFLNRMLELPGFEFDEIHGKLYYRYVLLSPIENYSEKIVKAIIGIIIVILALFIEVIENVASGKQTFDEVLEQILDSAQKMDSK